MFSAVLWRLPAKLQNFQRTSILCPVNYCSHRAHLARPAQKNQLPEIRNLLSQPNLMNTLMPDGKQKCVSTNLE